MAFNITKRTHPHTRSKLIKARQQHGRGLSFFYNAVNSSIAAVPVNVQEAPFIFNLQTKDFQALTVQGQISYQIVDALKMAGMLNFTLVKNGTNYVSEDPLKLSDRVLRVVQASIQSQIQATDLRSALTISQALTHYVHDQARSDATLQAMGIELLEVSISAILPTPETTRALEAEAREMILKEADDAIYARRKSAVEQERTIREAELNTALLVQQKEQEIEESRIENERALLRAQAETERERLQARIAEETQRKDLVNTQMENRQKEADAEAYAVSTKMNAFKQLPVEHLKAMALAQMQPEQLMALAFEGLAQNANKIGELNISPDLFGQLMKRAK
ncbi:SPFH domain-containing protein [uncultured Thiothrix sp.]|uniref:SPFH domain-containing protein n=1 Tax=uncultured Thiothrix sp. TaxID=223185 RepID=UPI00262459DD|nr:SPFH domain-containing protein [uncultured Thiothrix sp.]